VVLFYAKSLDIYYGMFEKLSIIIENMNTFIWGPPFIMLLTVTSIYLSIKLRFPQLKICASIKEIFKVSRGTDGNRITQFKSLMTVLAGTLGTGNITGIAVAILVGGVGSLFWMLVSALLAMVISYAENYIVLMHRKKDKRKGYYGGTMYVLDEVLGKKKLAVFFALVVIIATVGSGTMTQANSLSTLLSDNLHVSESTIGIILGIVTAYTIFGGKRRIAKVSSRIIPICTLIYICLCVCILWKNRLGIIPGLSQILTVALGGKQIVGGVAGLSINVMIGKGFSIGMFSNEAGMGTAPMFTATVEDEDIEKGAGIAATSVVIDTIILCMLTGITIVSTGLYDVKSSSELLNGVFSQILFGKELLNICMVFFVLATIPCLEYYGEQAIAYLTKRRLWTYIFRTLYIIGIYVGSIMYSNVVWDISGIANALMMLPNIYMIYNLTDEIDNTKIIKKYKNKYK